MTCAFFLDFATSGSNSMFSTVVPESAALPLMARCHLCNVETRHNKISRHLKEVHEIGLVIHRCPRCDRSFKRKYKFDQHRLVCLGLAHLDFAGFGASGTGGPGGPLAP